jgi:hypothetical protein
MRIKLTTGLHYFYLWMYTFSLSMFFTYLCYIFYNVHYWFSIVIWVVWFFITFMTTATIDIYTSEKYNDLW